MVSPVARNGECSLSNEWTRSTPMFSRGGKLLEREDLGGDCSRPSTDVSSRLRGLSDCWQGAPSNIWVVTYRLRATAHA